MSLVSRPSESHTHIDETAQRGFFSSFFHLPRNVYLLLFFTLGKGFQLTIATLTVNYYAYSLGYHPDFIGLFSAMPALGALASAIPIGMLADRIGRKPVLIVSALLTPTFLAAIALGTSAPWLLICSLIQGFVSSAYWVSNLPLLTANTTEKQRVGVFALNSFLLLGIGSLGNLLGGAIPEFVAGVLHVSAASTVPLRWGVLTAALFTLVFGLPLWLLRDDRRAKQTPAQDPTSSLIPEQGQDTLSAPTRETFPLALFAQLLGSDLLFTMGEGAVVALIQLYFVLRFHLLPGQLGITFTISGFIGGIFALTAPLFAKRWGKLQIITTVMYLSAPLMILTGFAPVLPLAIGGEYTRSFLRTLIEPVYAAFEMEQVSDRYRGMLAGCYSVTWSIGYSIGPSIAGWLQTHVSLSTAFLFGAGCLIASATMLLSFFGKKKVCRAI
jgi:MFS family permease